jgi:hypothetical protein
VGQEAPNPPDGRFRAYGVSRKWGGWDFSRGTPERRKDNGVPSLSLADEKKRRSRALAPTLTLSYLVASAGSGGAGKSGGSIWAVNMQ